MSGPPSDTYYIVNVRSGNVAALADSSDRTPVAAAVKSNQERVKVSLTTIIVSSEVEILSLVTVGRN